MTEQTPAPPAPPDKAPSPEPEPEKRGAFSSPRALLRAAGLWLVVAMVIGLASLVLLYRPPADDTTPAAPERSVIQADDRDSPVVTFATDVLTTWSNRDKAYAAWWSGLRPMLTPGAREAYAGTDPAKLPDLGAMQATVMIKGVAGTTVTIYYKTDAGKFGVDLSRTAKDAPWRAHRIVFPGQSSVFE